jgi:hypothetical protein
MSHYLPLVDFYFKFDHEENIVDYRRWMDLERSVAGVEYSVGGARMRESILPLPCKSNYYQICQQ